MAVSPFYPFRNSSITFESESKNSSEVDEAGNIRPAKKKFTVEAYLKPTAYKSNTRIKDDYPGIGESAVLVTGYIVDDLETFPNSLVFMKRSVKCKYKGQEGTMIIVPQLQSSVGAERYTGLKIGGLFQIVGGQ
jgi:hypothetical protein